jgi:uncharacterized protein (DUF58 family)
MNVEHRQVFVLRIAAPRGAAGLHALRALLKRLLRQHGFRALDVREEHDIQLDAQVRAHHPHSNSGDDDA